MWFAAEHREVSHKNLGTRRPPARQEAPAHALLPTTHSPATTSVSRAAQGGCAGIPVIP
jgi:hypothetical protein